jgi:hypothetical protein
MMIELLEDILAFLLFPAFALYLLHYGWFKKYVFLIIGPIVYLIGVIVGLIVLTPDIATKLLKALLTVVLSVLLALIYGATYVIPYAGGRVEGWTKSLKDGIVTSYFTFQVYKMREIMVQIVAEEDDRNLTFENPEKYRTELTQVKKGAKNRLETGETVLSIILGAVLLISKVMNFELLQATIRGFPVGLLIEGWLLVIAVSIVYRSSVLELLAYSSDDDFKSLDEMDAALSYQKGVSLVGFIQGLVFLLTFSFAIMKVKHSLVEDALRAKYTDEPWIGLTWEKIRN